MTKLRTMIATAVLCAAGTAAADPMSKDQCVDAHSRGQDAKQQGQLSLARKLFLTCASGACPALIQGDCARFANDLDASQPTVTFAARDSSGTDLPDTSVYVDGSLMVTRLDGKPHDLDPGKHEIRFTHGEVTQTQTIVIASGEKARSIVAKFSGGAAASSPSEETVVPVIEVKRTPQTRHPAGASVVMVLGTAAVLGGAAFGIIGITRIPSNCSISTHQCAAAPGDPAFGQAAKGMRWADIGFTLAGAGAVVFTAGLIAYVAGASTPHEDNGLSTWLTPTGAGLTYSGRL